MNIADHLSSTELHHMNNIKKKDKSSNKITEKLSSRDIADLMVTNRSTYKRVRGAIRNK